MTPANPPAVLSIHSRVSTRAVGNSLTEAAFARHAPELSLYTLDTVLWTAPGNHPRAVGPVTEPEELERMLEMLLDPAEKDGGGVGHVVIGYLRTPEQVLAVARALGNKRPQSIILDPILGDNGRLYVAEETARAIRWSLLPMADYLLPNFTEAHWLAFDQAEWKEQAEASLPEIWQRLSGSFPKLHRLVVTGIPLQQNGGEKFGVAFREGGEPGPTILSNPAIAGMFHGTGDLFTALFSAHLLSSPHDDRFDHAVRFAQETTRRALEDWAEGKATRLRA